MHSLPKPPPHLILSIVEVNPVSLLELILPHAHSARLIIISPLRVPHHTAGVQQIKSVPHHVPFQKILQLKGEKTEDLDFLYLSDSSDDIKPDNFRPTSPEWKYESASTSGAYSSFTPLVPSCSLAKGLLTKS